MARYLRVEYPGALYHVTVGMLGEGVQSRRLFRDEQDHLHFLKRLEARVETYGCNLVASSFPPSRVPAPHRVPRRPRYGVAHPRRRRIGRILSLFGSFC